MVSSPEVEEGFTVVRQSGIRVEKPAQKMVFAAGSSGGRSNRSLRELPKNQGVEISNRFGGLEEDMVSAEIGEVAILEGSNKENKYKGKNMRKESGVTQVKEAQVNVTFKKGKGGNKGGPKWKRNGGLIIMEPNGPRQKQGSVNKPVRGLIFGPTKGESSNLVGDALSANGKRLRVEQRSVGRPGGAFVSGLETRSGEMDMSMELPQNMNQIQQSKELLCDTAIVV